jgi:hypothetical protein
MSRLTRRTQLTLVLALFIALASSFDVARAADPSPSDCGIAECWLTGGGAATAISQKDLNKIRQNVDHSGEPTSESTVTPACPGNDPNVGGPYDISCGYLTSICVNGQWDFPVGGQMISSLADM